MGAIEEYFSHDVEERSFEIGGRATSRTSRLMDIAAEYESEIKRLSEENEQLSEENERYRTRNLKLEQKVSSLCRELETLQDQYDEFRKKNKEDQGNVWKMAYQKEEDEHANPFIRLFSKDARKTEQEKPVLNVIHNHMAGSIYINQSDVSGSYVLGSSPESIERFKQLR